MNTKEKINQEVIELTPPAKDNEPAVTAPIVVYDKAAKCHRNEPCRCGSGKKYKHCCMKEHRTGERAHYYH